jgi:DNA uptake protein ComE-like DNA-binding protein
MRRSGSDSFAVVDLNLAPAADLGTLPGIDPPLADSIVDYRRFRGARHQRVHGR